MRQIQSTSNSNQLAIIQLISCCASVKWRAQRSLGRGREVGRRGAEGGALRPLINRAGPQPKRGKCVSWSFSVDVRALLCQNTNRQQVPLWNRSDTEIDRRPRPVEKWKWHHWVTQKALTSTFDVIVVPTTVNVGWKICRMDVKLLRSCCTYRISTWFYVIYSSFIHHFWIFWYR